MQGGKVKEKPSQNEYDLNTRVRVAIKEAINVYLMSVCTGYLFDQFLLVNTKCLQ